MLWWPRNGIRCVLEVGREGTAAGVGPAGGDRERAGVACSALTMHPCNGCRPPEKVQFLSLPLLKTRHSWACNSLITGPFEDLFEGLHSSHAAGLSESEGMRQWVGLRLFLTPCLQDLFPTTATFLMELSCWHPTLVTQKLCTSYIIG